MIKHLQCTTLLLSILYFIHLLPQIPTEQPSFIFPTIPIKLDTSNPIKIEPGPIQLQLPDFSKVGGELGRGIGDLFSLGANSFADTVGGEQYGNDISRGMSGFASNMGHAMGDFNIAAESKLFPELGTTFRGIARSAINPRNVFEFGGLVALSFVVTTTGYYLTKLLWEVVTYKILNPKPVILLPSTTYGRWDRFKRWWKGYKTPAMLFDQSVKERLEEIEEKTKMIRTHNRTRKNRRSLITYDNLLLHGKPGTGKTLFARILADRTNMDFVATTAASLLQSGTAGVKYFNDIMAMARRSAYGLILFIDEADALFIDRNTLNPDSDHYKILSHILAITGDGNSNFMLIAATNHAYIMDDAMGRRFQDRVLMPLPDEQTRTNLISLYAQKYLFTLQNNSKKYVKEAKSLLNILVINEIANRTSGLSHAEIKDMIEAIHKKACSSKNGMITVLHIKQAVDQAIEKHVVLEEDRNKKHMRFNNFYA
ncbi:MAG TPA: AAA family ATPase [Candidatus Babeliales bacterium]|nr:AAA family ATPase [Candidatus Babeliales bacterium]